MAGGSRLLCANVGAIAGAAAAPVLCIESSIICIAYIVNE